MNDTATTRRLRRSTTDRKLGGVAGGLGEYLGVDPVLVRIGFVLTVFAGGAGLLAYLVAWVLIPEGDGTAAAPSRDANTIAGVVVLALAATLLLNGWWLSGDIVLPVLLIGAGAYLLLRDGGAGGHEGGHEGGDDAATTAPPPPSPPPPRARPTGPPTGRITAGLVAMVAGGFGIAVAAGTEVSAEAVLLSCLAVTGGGLVVGAFTGRARGLIGLAVPLLLALSVTSVVDPNLTGGFGDREYVPLTVRELRAEYELAAGTLLLDLRQLSAEELTRARGDAIRVEVRIGAGEVRVLTPPEVTVVVDAEVDLGEVDLFGDVDDGSDIEVRAERPGPTDAPVLEIVADATLGEVVIR